MSQRKFHRYICNSIFKKEWKIILHTFKINYLLIINKTCRPNPIALIIWQYFSQFLKNQGLLPLRWAILNFDFQSVTFTVQSREVVAIKLYEESHRNEIMLSGRTNQLSTQYLCGCSWAYLQMFQSWCPSTLPIHLRYMLPAEIPDLSNQSISNLI